MNARRKFMPYKQRLLEGIMTILYCISIIKFFDNINNEQIFLRIQQCEQIIISFRLTKYCKNVEMK